MNNGDEIIYCPYCGNSGKVKAVEFSGNMNGSWNWRFVLTIEHGGRICQSQFWKDS